MYVKHVQLGLIFVFQDSDKLAFLKQDQLLFLKKVSFSFSCLDIYAV